MFPEIDEKSDEKRSEIVSVWVTPEVKKELQKFESDDKTKQEIIRRFIKTETDWLEQEIREIDEARIKYEAKLIGIKDSYEKAQNEYVKLVNQIYDNTVKEQKKADQVFDKTEKLIDRVLHRAFELDKKMKSISYYSLEKLIETVQKFQGLDKDSKELIKLMILKEDKKG